MTDRNRFDALLAFDLGLAVAANAVVDMYYRCMLDPKFFGIGLNEPRSSNFG